jgi:formamidase
MRLLIRQTITLIICAICSLTAVAAEKESIVVGATEGFCVDDASCTNRLHPAIPMTHRVNPGQTILFHTRDAADVLGTVAAQRADTDEGQALRAGIVDKSRFLGMSHSAAHPMAGPLYIEGAMPGDVLKVTIISIDPGEFGWTFGSGGFIRDLMEGQFLAVWRLNKEFAESDDIPGIRIPNGSFPGVVSTLPGPNQLRTILKREQQLADAGAQVMLPFANGATPSSICGPNGSAAEECLRTFPPREHGGNMDIRYLQPGVSIYLPCYLEGCGLTIGDLHYAQGDGEVSGSAIEMSADISVTTELLRNGPDLTHGPHYEGDSRVLDIPSKRFYAVTGIPVKKPHDVPPHMEYLDSKVLGPLGNVSIDLNIAARNALDGMIDHIVTNYGYNRNQAYVIASVAVDLRITQLVDAPNVGVTAVLPLDIFVGKSARSMGSKESKSIDF